MSHSTKVRQSRASQELRLSGPQQALLRSLVAQVITESNQRWQSMADSWEHPADLVLGRAVKFFNSLKPEQQKQVLGRLQKKSWIGALQ